MHLIIINLLLSCGKKAICFHSGCPQRASVGAWFHSNEAEAIPEATEWLRLDWNENLHPHQWQRLYLSVVMVCGALVFTDELQSVKPYKIANKWIGQLGAPNKLSAWMLTFLFCVIILILSSLILTSFFFFYLLHCCHKTDGDMFCADYSHRCSIRCKM